MAELEALKREKGDAEEARKMAEEQTETTRKDYEEKVINYILFSWFLIAILFGRVTKHNPQLCTELFVLMCNLMDLAGEIHES